MNHERCKICQWNKDGHTTPETCKKMCNYRYDYKRRIRICDLENKVKTLTEENNLLKEELYKKSESEQVLQTALEEIQTLKADRTLERISKLNIENAELKQEIEELRKKYNENLNEEYDKRAILKLEFEQLKNEKMQCLFYHKEINKCTLFRDIIKYKLALEKIQDRVNEDCKGCTSECDCDETCTRCFIKDKINEVLK